MFKRTLTGLAAGALVVGLAATASPATAAPASTDGKAKTVAPVVVVDGKAKGITPAASTDGKAKTIAPTTIPNTPAPSGSKWTGTAPVDGLTVVGGTQGKAKSGASTQASAPKWSAVLVLGSGLKRCSVAVEYVIYDSGYRGITKVWRASGTPGSDGELYLHGSPSVPTFTLPYYSDHSLGANSPVSPTLLATTTPKITCFMAGNQGVLTGYLDLRP